MKNILSMLQEIESSPHQSNISSKLGLLFEEIDYLFLKISFCKNIKEASIYFDLLDKIQLTIGTLQHTYGISLSDDLKQFVVDFDQLHDNNVQERLFTEIKKGCYSNEKLDASRLLKLLEDIKNEPNKADVEPKLYFLYQEITRLFIQIKNCETIAAAQIYFDLLEKIQSVLSGLAFKYEVTMADSLRKFIRDCDRLDDNWLREYLFNKIKHGQYSL